MDGSLLPRPSPPPLGRRLRRTTFVSHCDGRASLLSFMAVICKPIICVHVCADTNVRYESFKAQAACKRMVLSTSESCLSVCGLLSQYVACCHNHVCLSCRDTLPPLCPRLVTLSIWRADGQRRDSCDQMTRICGEGPIRSLTFGPISFHSRIQVRTS
jgi:hypothetical protein|eukprot:COSAG03_NODE_82_length_13990_cov_63.581744_6_plen_158_part_00